MAQTYVRGHLRNGRYVRPHYRTVHRGTGSQRRAQYRTVGTARPARSGAAAVGGGGLLLLLLILLLVVANSGSSEQPAPKSTSSHSASR